MTNKQITRYIEAFKESRREWVDILVRNHDHTNAASTIVIINAKIELLRSMWNWNEEGEMP